MILISLLLQKTAIQISLMATYINIMASSKEPKGRIRTHKHNKIYKYTRSMELGIINLAFELFFYQISYRKMNEFVRNFHHFVSRTKFYGVRE